MRESNIQTKLLRALRDRLPDAVVWKLSDRFTTGIPDVMVSLNSVVTWLELKAGRNGITRIQWETLRRLKRGFVVQEWEGKYTVTLAVHMEPVKQAPELSTVVDSFEELVRHIDMLVRFDDVSAL